MTSQMPADRMAQAGFVATLCGPHTTPTTTPTPPNPIAARSTARRSCALRTEYAIPPWSDPVHPPHRNSARPTGRRTSGTLSRQCASAPTPTPPIRSRGTQRCEANPVRPGRRNSTPRIQARGDGGTILRNVASGHTTRRFLAIWRKQPTARGDAINIDQRLRGQELGSSGVRIELSRVQPSF